MGHLIAEEATRTQLQGLTAFTEIRDGEGRLLGYFFPAEAADNQPIRSPIPLEEIERRRRERVAGPSLHEFLAELQDRQ
jgi:hypothetical protein